MFSRGATRRCICVCAILAGNPRGDCFLHTSSYTIAYIPPLPWLPRQPKMRAGFSVRSGEAHALEFARTHNPLIVCPSIAYRCAINKLAGGTRVVRRGAIVAGARAATVPREALPVRPTGDKPLLSARGVTTAAHSKRYGIHRSRKDQILRLFSFRSRENVSNSIHFQT